MVLTTTTTNFIGQIKNEYGSWGKIYAVNDLMEEIKKELSEHNFKKENSRLVYSVCPDDVNRLQELDTVENALRNTYNGEFHLGGLGAYPIGGLSGITAASHHPPDNINGGRTDGNLILFISPHFGLMKGDDFIYGKIIRPGQEKITSSCGAMMGFLSQLKQSGSPRDFKIAPDEKNLDPTRIVLHRELINNYSEKLKELLSNEDDNQQVIDLFKINYDLVMNKVKEIVEAFLEKEKEHFKGEIAIIGGITVNIPEKDLFILKEITFPNK